MKKIKVIGGGLAGPEAALQAASLGCDVTLYEMRPHRSTEAHETANFAELVCSNSLKSESENSAPWLLKQEMRQAGSFLLSAADAAAVPAGHALAVDRIEFSARVQKLIDDHPRITVVREEVTRIDETDPDTITILASGPLTSPPLAAELQRLTGAAQLAFYDSIAPIAEVTVEAGCTTVVFDAGDGPLPAGVVRVRLPVNEGIAAAASMLLSLQELNIAVALRRIPRGIGTPLRTSKVTI